MEQNDIVSQIMALIGQKEPRKEMPMVSGPGSSFPPMKRPAGIMPQPGGMPPDAQQTALQMALGEVPEMGGAFPVGVESGGDYSQYGRTVMSNEMPVDMVPGMMGKGPLPPEILELVLQGKMAPSPRPVPRKFSNGNPAVNVPPLWKQ